MANVNITLTYKNGEIKQFSAPTGTPQCVCDYKILQESLKKLQEETNQTLTALVNQEKARNGATNQTNSTSPVSGL